MVPKVLFGSAKQKGPIWLHCKGAERLKQVQIKMADKD
jgi:hypothetical protein